MIHFLACLISLNQYEFFKVHLLICMDIVILRIENLYLHPYLI